jgi:hypothetical protein
MFSLQLMRITMFRWMNEPKNYLFETTRISYSTLRNTLMADEADREKERDDEPIDVLKTLDEIEMTVRETQVLKRSNRIRKACEFIPESAIKKRKAFYCAAGTGYLNKEPGAAN